MFTMGFSVQAILEDFGLLDLLSKSAPGYQPPWAGIVKAMPSPLELHALIGNGSCLAYGGN